MDTMLNRYGHIFGLAFLHLPLFIFCIYCFNCSLLVRICWSLEFTFFWAFSFLPQALGMLFWHKHNLDKSLTDLANFTPFPGIGSIVFIVKCHQPCVWWFFNHWKDVCNNAWVTIHAISNVHCILQENAGHFAVEMCQ